MSLHRSGGQLGELERRTIDLGRILLPMGFIWRLYPCLSILFRIKGRFVRGTECGSSTPRTTVPSKVTRVRPASSSKRKYAYHLEAGIAASDGGDFVPAKPDKQPIQLL